MRFTRRGRAVRAISSVLLGTVVLTVTGCATPPIASTTLYADQVRNARPTGTLPWFCHSVGTGSAHQHGGLADDAYAGMTKGDLTWDQCQGVAEFFDKAWASVRRYPTRRDAQAAGSMQAVQHVLGTGTHDVVPGVNNWQYNTPDPVHPFYLQYDGDGPDAKLAGMSWYVVRTQAGPPEGVPGNNDWWHTHEKLCYTGVGVVVGTEITDEACKALGGTNVAYPNSWMMHAWIVPGYEFRRDVFAGAFGCVNARTGPNAAADDPCQFYFDGDHHAEPPIPAPGPGTPTTTMPPMDHGH